MTDIDLFDYPLPEEHIAHRPLSRRDESRLMTVNRKSGDVSHAAFREFPDLLRAGDVVVANSSRVFPARLLGRRKTGGRIEILLVRKSGAGEWEAVTGGMARVKPGEALIVGDGEAVLAEKLEGGMARVRFGSDEEAERLIESFGEVPLPPYIHRPDGKTDVEDRARYQTVFAKQAGSCAAPTAGLHFTNEVLDTMRSKGVAVAEIVLHVGPGTFRPVASNTIENHVMDPEPYEIPDVAAEEINRAKRDGRRIIAVGSTVIRTLEGAAGDNGFIRPGSGSTSLYITPGFTFRTADAMLTNFHLPRSTLLILVSAFAGREPIMRAYEEAIRERYRFYSYGDAMFIS